MKTKQKTEVQERTALRANEQRRLDHAYKTFAELMTKHNLDERDVAELFAMKVKLDHAIKNQHIKDARYAAYKAQQIDTDSIQGY